MKWYIRVSVMASFLIELAFPICVYSECDLHKQELITQEAPALRLRQLAKTHAVNLGEHSEQ